MSSPLNSYFNQIYLINLPRRPDKLTKVLAQLDRYQIKVRVIAATDGRDPQIFFQQNKIPVGAYGYILTWERIINNAITNQYQRILILDDDVVLHHDFNHLFEEWTSSINNWKILLLGATQHTQRPDLIIPTKKSKIQSYHPRIIDGSFAVGIDRSIYLQLANQLKTHQDLVDSIVLRRVYNLYSNQCYVAYPNLMMADVTTSDIRSTRSQEELAKKVEWNLDNYHWPNQTPLISLIISCYNAEKTIKRCLSSVLTQTYRPLELIITDDGSTDRTFELISDVLEKWNYLPKAKGISIKLHRHAINRGAYVARNQGISQAEGEFITFQDADDISLNNRLEDQLNHLLQWGVEFTTCLILRTHLSELSEDPQILEQQIKETRVHTNKYCCRSKVGLVTTLFRRRLVQKLGKYQETKWGADAQYLRRLFPKLDPNYQMMNYLNETEYIPGLYYRVPEVMYLSYEMTSDNLTHQRLRATKS